jgi:nucleoside-diphosphate-sugar epimerase
MKYFITGATGFVGGRIAQHLIDGGHEVIALVRTPSKAQALKDMGATIAEGDITDKESMREPMTGVDGVFHVAAWYKVGAKDKHLAQGINVDGTRNVLELMKELNIPKGVYTSTLAVNSDTKGEKKDETYRFTGKHLSEYDRTKAAAHHEVAEPMIKDGLPLVIVMPGMVYGRGDQSDIHDYIVQYVKGKLPALPARTAVCAAHIDDVAHGHILAMEKVKPGETYIICGPCLTFVEFFKIAETITGIPAPRITIPSAVLKVGSQAMRVVEKFVDLPVAYTSEGMRVSAGATYLGDNSKAKRELGYDPRPVEVGLKETLEYELEQLGVQPRK